jgi:hypothetical protein
MNGFGFGFGWTKRMVGFSFGCEGRLVVRFSSGFAHHFNWLLWSRFGSIIRPLPGLATHGRSARALSHDAVAGAKIAM